MHRSGRFPLASRRAPAARSLRNLNAVGYSIAAAGLCLASGASCRATPLHSKFNPCILALLALVMVSPAAQAAVVLQSQLRTVGADGTISGGRGLNEFGPPFTSELNESFDAGSIRLQQISVVDVIPDSGILAGASGSGNLAGSPGGFSFFEIRFDVTDNPVSVSLQAQVTQSGGPHAQIALVRVTGGGATLLNLLRGSDQPGTGVETFESELDIGNYLFRAHTLLGGTSGTGSWEFDLAFPLRWVNPVDGTFSDGTKWSVGHAPSEKNVALFDRSGAYTVQFDENVTNRAMRVKGAGVDVMFDLNGFEYHADELHVSDGASVTFGADGGPVSVTEMAAAASDELPIEPIVFIPIVSFVDGRGVVKVGTEVSRLLIDKGASSLHVVGPDGKLRVNELTVAKDGPGALRVSGGGVVFSPSAVLGENAGSSATVTLLGSDSRWNTDSLLVGLRGRGELNIRDGAHVGAGVIVTVADRSTSFGTINVEGPGSLLTAGRLRLGDIGKAILNVKDLAKVEVDELVIQGLNTLDDSDGANIRDFGKVDVKNQLTVAGGGRLIVGNNGFVENESLDPAENAGTVIVPTGKLIIRSGGQFHEHHSLAVNGELRINPTALMASVGELAVRRTGVLAVTNGGILSGNGLIRSDGIADFGGVHNFMGNVLPGSSPGTLTIEGNYEQTGGLLGIEIAGTAPGQFDVLKVTGDVSLGGSLLLQFIDGFAPRQGDAFQFLDGAGTFSGAFANVEVRGLLPGFQFDLRSDAGGLTMIALNDGLAVPEPATTILLAAAALVWPFRRCAHIPLAA